MKPTVFISSTIYDFRDLRSAIKYYLEELGYEVFLSESNDFPGPLDKNTFEACLSVLERADYYLLIIGGRVGAYFDDSNKVSVTRMEYRKAYDLATSGRVRLIAFVRDDLWKVKTDRRALADLLDKDDDLSKDISPKDKKRIAAHTSPIVNDAEVQFSFIDEVTRAAEMSMAAKGSGPPPGPNWVHAFSSFRDIADVLRTHLSISDSLSVVALRANLRTELLRNIATLGMKSKGQVSFNYKWALKACKSISGGFNDASVMPSRYLRWLVMFSLIGSTGSRLSHDFIDHAVISGNYLKYNRESGAFEPTQISEMLMELKDRIERLKNMGGELHSKLVEFVAEYSDICRGESDVSVKNQDLMVPASLAQLQEDIVAICAGLLRAIDGDYEALGRIRLNPSSPIPVEAELLNKETVTLVDVEKWLASPTDGHTV